MIRLACVHAFRAIAAGMQGAWPEALASRRRARRLARQTGFAYLSYLAAVPYGLALVRTGYPECGVRVQEPAVALAARAGTRIFVPTARPAWGRRVAGGRPYAVSSTVSAKPVPTKREVSIEATLG